LVFGTGKGAGKLISVMAVVVAGFFVFNYIQKRRA
tara:strand:+ start:349 stop:453 length:105 start_codon:yes stop_codon:yes gene_type:complete